MENLVYSEFSTFFEKVSLSHHIAGLLILLYKSYYIRFSIEELINIKSIGCKKIIAPVKTAGTI